ncbi:fibrinogen-like protein [Apostichopus japonicus]|uniref:Fibrinogen-like protein n=1 Tax=Stichopus japonicus TaxID=307972 RepID=A0A2G8JTC3_STIJA|nr:fibrinogen-like protein [Apostichopus japonicus]
MIYGTCTCQATCEDPNGQSGCNSDCLGTEGCTCPAGFLMQGVTASVRVNAGVSWQRSTWLYQDCQDVYDAGNTQDGVYSIMPTGWPGSPFNVHCRMHGDEGWTVFQRRTDDGTSFYQDWDAYKDGFGNNVNFWLGNEKLYYLTNQDDYKLRLDITTSDGTSLYSEYTEFQIESEDTNYKMNKLGNRTSPSGSAGNYLYYSKGKQFSTYDRDNDACEHFNCAEKHRSGWWHINYSYGCSSCYRSDSRCSRFQYNGNCHSVCTYDNLNGDYNGGNGQNIFSYYNNYCNPQTVEMKIRPSS